MVNGTGLIDLAGRQFNVGYELAGQRVTLRMDGRRPAARVASAARITASPALRPSTSDDRTARKEVTVTAEDDQFRLVIDDEMIGAVASARTTREIHRFKAYARPSAPPSNTPRQEGRQR